jgi:short-subunit dehydrogenase
VAGVWGFDSLASHQNAVKVFILTKSMLSHWELNLKASIYIPGLEHYAATVEPHLDGLEIGTLINNVGMTYPTPEHFHRITSSLEFVQRMININVGAVTMMTRLVLPGMLDRGKGVIVNVGTIASLQGAPYFSLYSSTKAFMQTLTLDLAREYR